MTTEQIQKTEPYAEFVGYQKDDKVGGVRAWYVIHAPKYARHLSTVFAPTLVELGIKIPDTPPYFPKSKFDSVWVFKCENPKCHITYLDKNQVIKHVKETKHYQIVQELVTMVKPEEDTLELPECQLPKKAIYIEQNQEEEEFVEKKKPKLVLIGPKNERLAFDSVKDALESTQPEKIPEVTSSRVVDYSEHKPESDQKKFVPKSDEQIKKEVEADALAFRKKIQADFPNVNWRD